MSQTKLATGLPKGWDESRLRNILLHYEQQSEAAAVAEDEAAFADLNGIQPPSSMWAVVRQGKIELLTETTLPEGSRVLVTLLPELVPAT
jgi:hypothetical protein